MLDSRSAIRAWRESIFAVLSASKALSSSEPWRTFPPKEKSFARSGSKSNLTEFSRLTIGTNCRELIRPCCGIPFWRRRPAIKTERGSYVDGTGHPTELHRFGGLKFPRYYTSYFVGKAPKYFISGEIRGTDPTDILLEDVPILSSVKWCTWNPRKTRNVKRRQGSRRQSDCLHVFTSNGLAIKTMTAIQLWKSRRSRILLN